MRQKPGSNYRELHPEVAVRKAAKAPGALGKTGIDGLLMAEHI